MNTIDLRILYPLPLYVDGGKTRWRIIEYKEVRGDIEWFTIMAYCVSTYEKVLIDHRIGSQVFNRNYWGFSVSSRTTAGKIMRRLVKDGLAEYVDFMPRLHIK